MSVWLLIAVMLDNGNVYTQVYKEPFTLMEQCFETRDTVIAKLDEWPAVNMQFVCIRADAQGIGAL